jgi:hypothetical protein
MEGRATRGVGMGNIGTERREVEFEPLPEEPVSEPQRESDPAAPSQVPTQP